MFFCKLYKILKNIFWQNTSGWLRLVFKREFWEIFLNIYFIEHFYEAVYLMYKLQNFNQQIQ